MRELSGSCKPIFNALQWTLATFSADNVPDAIRDIFQYLSSSSPVCSYMFTSNFVISIAEALFENNIKLNHELMRSIQNELPLFFNVLASLNIEQCLPQEWKGLVLFLIDVSQQHFNNAEPVNTTACSSSNEIGWLEIFVLHYRFFQGLILIYKS